MPLIKMEAVSTSLEMAFMISSKRLNRWAHPSLKHPIKLLSVPHQVKKLAPAEEMAQPMPTAELEVTSIRNQEPQAQVGDQDLKEIRWN